jgi:hypothetical protein
VLWYVNIYPLSLTVSEINLPKRDQQTAVFCQMIICMGYWCVLNNLVLLLRKGVKKDTESEISCIWQLYRTLIFDLILMPFFFFFELIMLWVSGMYYVHGFLLCLTVSQIKSTERCLQVPNSKSCIFIFKAF